MKYLIINKWQLKDCTTPPAVPSSIKLYESKSIIDLIKGIDKAVPIAVDDWALIQNKLIGIKNN
jgi:hypothetical protein